MNVDFEEIVMAARGSTNVMHANSERVSTYAIKPTEFYLAAILTLQSLGVNVEKPLQDAKNDLVRDYALSEVADGFASAKLKCDDYIGNINFEIAKQVGRSR